MLHEDFGEIANERIYWSIRAMEKNAGVVHARLVSERKHVSARQKACRQRNPRTPHQKVRVSLQGRLKSALKAQDTARQIRGFGYTIQEAIDHLEGLFVPGMNWGNHGAWEIDHVRPVRLYDLTKKEDQIACFALSNLQPLWKSDNRKKSGTWIEPESGAYAMLHGIDA